MPDRIQLSRAKGWRMPPDTILVSRPSMWGNPWREGKPATFWLPDYPVKNAPLFYWMSAEQAVAQYRYVVQGAIRPHRNFLPECLNSAGVFDMQKRLALQGDTIRANIHQLRGKNLACWCKPGEPCHADVLLELANKEALK